MRSVIAAVAPMIAGAIRWVTRRISLRSSAAAKIGAAEAGIRIPGKVARWARIASAGTAAIMATAETMSSSGASVHRRGMKSALHIRNRTAIAEILIRAAVPDRAKLTAPTGREARIATIGTIATAAVRNSAPTDRAI